MVIKLLVQHIRHAGGASPTRGVSWGGYSANPLLLKCGFTDTNFVEISYTSGNAEDFGDLSQGRETSLGGCSNGHGGYIMSKINVRSFSNENDDGAPDIVGITTFSATSYFVPTRGTTAQRPSDHVEVGSLRYNYDIKNLEFYRGDTIGWSSV